MNARLALLTVFIFVGCQNVDQPGSDAGTATGGGAATGGGKATGGGGTTSTGGGTASTGGGTASTGGGTASTGGGTTSTGGGMASTGGGTASTGGGTASTGGGTTSTGGGTTSTGGGTASTGGGTAVLPPANLTYAGGLSCTKGLACTLAAPTASGGPITLFTIAPTLPAGLSIAADTGVISGTPSALAASSTWTVTAGNSAGTTTAMVTIVVNDVAPSNLTYSANPVTYVKSTAIAANSPSSSGGPVVSYSVAPELPAGLTLSTTTGIITGTPTTVLAQATYTVTAQNSGGSTTVNLKVTINDAPPANLVYTPASLVCTQTLPCGPATPSSSGGPVVSYAVSPSLPNGLTLNLTSGVISGTATAVTASATYTVTATNLSGTTTKDLTISVVAPTTLTVTLKSIGGGVGSVVSTPAGINCGATCQASFSTTATASLSTLVTGGNEFLGWSGDCTGQTCSLSMSANHVVTATFGPPTNLFFVTSTAVPMASITSLAAGDQICNSMATSAKLPGTYKAWLSTSTVDAIDRFGAARGWVMVDGSPFIDFITDVLAENKFLYSAQLDELGQRGNGLVATATTYTGKYGGLNCSNFTSFTSADHVTIGNNFGTGTQFHDVGFGLCSNSYRLYCFGVDKTAAVTVPVVPARKAFQTASIWVPGDGLSSADALCGSEATGAGLSGVFRAFLPTSTAGGLARVDVNGLAWARPDGVLLAKSVALLGSGQWIARPTQRADGTYSTPGNSYWGNGVNFSSTTTCLNWTSSSGADEADTTMIDYSNGSLANCNTGAHLVCLQN